MVTSPPRRTPPSGSGTLGRRAGHVEHRPAADGDGEGRHGSGGPAGTRGFTRLKGVPRVLPLTRTPPPGPRAAEFFAGIGLVRLGLEDAGFSVPWSNDIEPDKQAMYVNHFRDSPQDHEYALGDVADLAAADLPAGLDLAWASFPCTDLSLAGRRRGLIGQHSATFWHFTRILDEMGSDRPPVVALENVNGLATSHGGQDLIAAIAELNRLGYSVDLLSIDARRFVPQSRQRLFLVGALTPPDVVHPDQQVQDPLRPEWLRWAFDRPDLRTHRAVLPDPPSLLQRGLSGSVEKLTAGDARWWDEERTQALIDSLSPLQLERIELLRHKRTSSYRTAYRRTRYGVAVWEIRPDEIAGCLRTARGGSSKQVLVEAGKGRVRARWMTPREYANLMGAPRYRIDGLRNNQALFGFGDAVCVPVVGWLADNYLMPLVTGSMTTTGYDTELEVAHG